MDILFLVVLGLILGLLIWSSKRAEKKEEESYPCIKELNGFYGVQVSRYAFADMRGRHDQWQTDQFIREFCLTEDRQWAEKVLENHILEKLKDETVKTLRSAPPVDVT